MDLSYFKFLREVFKHRYLSHVTTSPGQNSVDGRNTIGRSLDLDEVVRLHQTGRGHQECRIRDSPKVIEIVISLYVLGD